MSELKSAWEVAQERAAKLGKLSAEEKEKQETQAYCQIGHTLAQRWLDGVPEWNLTAELDKQDEQKKEIVRRAIIKRLAETIDITTAPNRDKTKKVLEAISALEPVAKPKAEEITSLLQQCEEAEQKIRRELEIARRQALHKLRISGTAVDTADVESDRQWQSTHQKLVEAFAPRLNDLKRGLPA